MVTVLGGTVGDLSGNIFPGSWQKIRTAAESPGPTDALAPDEAALSTGAGLAEASHSGTETPEEGGEAIVKPRIPMTVDSEIFERGANHANPLEYCRRVGQCGS